MLRKHDLLSEHQFGFQQNRSTTIHCCSKLLMTGYSLSLEHRDSIHCLFLDYAKGFDSVPHEHLYTPEIRIPWDKWQSFLTKRFQRVVVNDSYSDWAPQGSVLGLLLFLIYVNELTTISKVCKLENRTSFRHAILINISVVLSISNFLL